MSSPRVPSHADSDTEHTAELPVLDPAAQAAAGEHRQSQSDNTLILPPLAAPPTEASTPAAHPGEHRMSQTDTWIAPVAAGPAEARDARAGEHRQSQSDNTLILPPPAAGPAEAAPPAARHAAPPSGPR